MERRVGEVLALIGLMTPDQIETVLAKLSNKGVLPREAFLIKIRFVDAIDKTSVGKIDKVVLRAKYVS